MEIKEFMYDDKERNVLVVGENEESIFGYDLSKEEIKQLNSKYRHFKKDKIKDKINLESLYKTTKRHDI